MEVEYMSLFARCRDRNLVEERLLSKELARIDESIAQTKLMYKLELTEKQRESSRLIAEANRARRRQRKRRVEQLTAQFDPPRTAVELSGAVSGVATGPEASLNVHQDRLDLRTPATPLKRSATTPNKLAPPMSPIQGGLSPAGSFVHPNNLAYKHTENFACFFKIQQIFAKQQKEQDPKKKRKKRNGKDDTLQKSNLKKTAERPHPKNASHALIRRKLKAQEQKVEKELPWVGEPEAIHSIRRDRRAAKELIEVEDLREPIRKLTRELSSLSTCSKNCHKKFSMGVVKPVHNASEVDVINSQIFCPQNILDDLQPLASRSNVNNRALVGYLHSTWERTLSNIDLHNPAYLSKKVEAHQTCLSTEASSKQEALLQKSESSVSSANSSLHRMGSEVSL